MTTGRRTFLRQAAALAAVGALSSCASAPPAVKRIPRVGVLNFPNTALRDEFLSGLRELGYEDGTTIRIEWQNSENDTEESIYPIAAEMAGSRVDVMAANGGAAQRAAKRATSAIPIVIVTGTDPVEAGLVRTLAQPGGNVTGIAGLGGVVDGKRLELLKEVAPGISRVAIVGDDNPTRKVRRTAVEDAARRLSIDVVTVEVHDASELPQALDAAARQGVDALLVLFIAVAGGGPDPHTLAFAGARRLPAAYGDFVYADAGGLLVFAVNLRKVFRRAGNYVARILNGERPAEMPVELPTDFHLIVNLKTARALGLTIPQSILSRATRVIE